MIPISPQLIHNANCPACKNDCVHINDVFFHGTHILTDCFCSSCQFNFFQTLPVGHAIFFPVAFLKDGSQSWFDSRASIWFARPLINSVVFRQSETASFEVESLKKYEEVIIVNCLDSCFGHVFTKLWNVESLLANHPKKGIIVLIPANCAWLVPAGVAEIWKVNAPMKAFEKKIAGLDSFVKTQWNRFQKVWLSNSYPYPDQHSVSLEKFVKRERFNLRDFEKDTHITFVLREDRFWHNSILLDFLFKLSVKSKTQKLFSWIFIQRQNRLVKNTIRLVLKQLPGATFSICGLGKHGAYPMYINDCRSTIINLEVEKKWTEVFSLSNIVIGVHGSSMLIPTSLAAGFINLVPRYKIPHLSEDTVLPYTNRYLSFLGRYLDEYSSPKLVANHLISMIRDFPYLYKTTEQ
jgi:hypothetical protein